MVNKNRVDVSQVFLVYMALVGDAEKTALALDMPVKDVLELAHKEQWSEKVKKISVLSKSGQPGDWERAQNRALNFVQCHQLRRIIDRSIVWLSEQEDGKLLIKTDAQGNQTLSARVFTDLAGAMERCHAMTYQALGDTVTERLEQPKGPEGELKTQALHAAVISALNRSNAPALPPASETLTTGAVEVVAQVANPSPQSN